MKLRRGCRTGICLALCALGTVVRADETEVRKAEPAVQGNVKFEVRTVIDHDSATPATVVRTNPFPREQGEIELTLLKDVEARLAPLNVESQGKYWIGLMCATPSDVLRTQLDLAADVGLVVEEVPDGGPAKKAGILQYDLLLSAVLSVNGQQETRPLKNLADLVNAVQAAETGVLKLEFLRRGRKQSLDVVPDERPKTTPMISSNISFTNVNSVSPSSSQALGFRWAGPMILNVGPASLPQGMTMEFQPDTQPERVVVKQGEQTWEAELKSLETLPVEITALVKQQLVARNSPTTKAIYSYRMTNVATPSLVVLGDVKVAAALPEDVTVTTVRKGTDPVKVTIKKGDQSWDVTEKELGQLPAELRPYAESALTGHRTPTIQQPFTKAFQMSAAAAATTNQGPAPRKGVVRSIQPAPKIERAVKNQRDRDIEQQIEQQLNDVMKQLEKLQDQIRRAEKHREAAEKSN